jgi:hypothetical protein
MLAGLGEIEFLDLSDDCDYDLLWSFEDTTGAQGIIFMFSFFVLLFRGDLLLSAESCELFSDLK